MLPDLDRAPDTDLPVRSVLPDVLAALSAPGSALLVAPPGSGKTTLVPLALADAIPGRIVVAQPRRIAARAAARRMAALTGTAPGGPVGYTVRGERRAGPATRVEVVTTGVLLRRLQRDPELPGTGAVLLDECHERHLDTDLALAFLVEVRAALRPDLALLAASATVDAERIATRLGNGVPVPVLSTPPAAYPVELVWSPPPGPAGPVTVPSGRPGGTATPRVDPRLLDHVAATVRRAVREATGDVLVFLPGAGEIAAVAGRLDDLRTELDVLTLHGRQPARVQDAALSPGARRRVVLATSVAESSLTVPGVRIVVDAGLSRQPRTDLARGLGTLVTVRVSRAGADQRAGRAAREAPGRVYRCWSPAQHERLAGHAAPEVAVADLTGFALELACWGHPDGTGLALPDPPPAAAMQVAGSTLRALGAVDDRGQVTARGRAIAAAGTHPRLARALIDGAALIGRDRAAEVVALLADDTLAGAGDDLMAAWRRLRGGVDRAASARWRDEVRRLAAAVPAGDLAPGGADLPDDLAAGLLVGLAFPERLARVRAPGTGTYLMASGTAASLAPGSALAGTPWLAVAVADRVPGSSAATIRLAVPVDEATARQAAEPLLAGSDEVGWVDGDVRARRVRTLGAIVLAEQRLSRPDRELLTDALLDGLRQEGVGLLRWSRDAVALRARLAFCHRAFGQPWPDVDDRALLDRARDWLGPDLGQARRRADLERVDAGQALRRLLPWPQAARLDELAPERLAVPSGSRIRVDYSDPAAPVLAVRVQEAFGWQTAPVIADGRVTVLLHLLSPAGRPVAVTSDLPSFWRTGYPRVRADLRGRYPRHAWPEDPAAAVPTRGTGRPRR
ncbi:ATP-dependent helicase HrpB [Rugosimonospora africana]|uniref:ATP-dependent helicase HrpB n=1 Tax=Rugosimonospora africana TaxID=556532 RepID=A0A8J3QRP4_9ACTN|nr:ATP-dependent helicase HrpB [Rugosimonospora africana]GIH15409.1 ATP-dependent helicase HrpB [Rugosimonospora africana]